MGNKNEGYLGGIMGGESRVESGGGGLKTTGILSLEEAGTQTVGATPGDDNWDDVTLLLNGEDATIADVSSASTALTVGSTTYVSQNTSVYKHGSGSLRFTHPSDGYANTYISYTGDTLSGDYTVEFWWRPDALPTADGTDEMLWECRAGATTYPLLFYTGYLVGSPQIQLVAEGGVQIDTSAVTLAANTWYHVALVRSSGTYTLFLDGVSQGTWANSTTINSTTHYIGRRYAIHSSKYYGLNGYLDDFRLTPGVARYTEDFDDDLPTESFPTSLLPVGGTTLPQLSWGGITGRSVLTEGSASQTLVNTGIFTLEEIYELTKSA